MREKFDKLRLKIKRYRRMSWSRRASEFKKSSRKPLAVPVITLAVLLVASGGIYWLARGTHNLPPVHDAKIVIISHDKQQQIVPSKEKTVGALLKKLNLQLDQGDVVEPSLTARIDQDQYRINIYRAKPVQVVDGGNLTYSFSAAKTPRAVAVAAGTQLYAEDDIVAEPTQNFIKQGAIGEQVVVHRATPVQVDLYGTPVVLRTQAKTVRDLIREKDIQLIKNDKVSLPLDTPITPNQQIAFLRTGTKTETVTETIATPVQSVKDASLAYGTKAIRQQGAPGQQTVTYEINIVNNVETGRKIIQNIVNKAPVTQVEVVGTSLSGIKGDMALAGISSDDYNYVDYIVSHESGWRPDAGSASGPYGLCQAYPGSKMASAGSDWATNPVTQLRWCSGYASGRYGSWAAAYNHWMASRNW